MAIWSRFRRAPHQPPRWDGPPRDVEDYRTRLSRVGLGAVEDRLVALVRPSVRLTPAVADAEAPAEAGGTRLGGEPDLPAATPWPRHREAPLSFVLQVDLATVAPLVEDDELPPAGLLSFFYAAVTQDAWGFDPADRGSWAVLYSAPDEVLERRPFPADLAGEGRFQARSLTAALEPSFAPAVSEDVRALGVEGEAYAPVLGESDERITRLLGQPEPIQGSMEDECQLASNGVYCGDGVPEHDPRVRALRAEAVRWRLLAQVDSHEEETGMMWGDLGRLYFWLRDDDLRARRWDRAWLVLQCY